MDPKVHFQTQVVSSSEDDIITPPRNREGVIYSLLFVCVCVSVRVSVSLSKFLPNECTDLDAVFAKWVANHIGSDPWVKGQSHSDVISIFQWLSMVIGILLQSTVQQSG